MSPGVFEAMPACRVPGTVKRARKQEWRMIYTREHIDSSRNEKKGTEASIICVRVCICTWTLVGALGFNESLELLCIVHGHWNFSVEFSDC